MTDREYFESRKAHYANVAAAEEHLRNAQAARDFNNPSNWRQVYPQPEPARQERQCNPRPPEPLPDMKDGFRKMQLIEKRHFAVEAVLVN